MYRIDEDERMMRVREWGEEERREKEEEEEEKESRGV